MEMKGLEKVREHLPNYPGKRIALIPLIGFIASIIGYAFLLILDVLPRLFSEIAFLVMIEPILPLIGSIFIAALALWLIGSVWNKRDSMKEKLGDLAYQKMFPRGFMRVFLVPPLVFHAFTSIRSLPPIPPVNDLTILFSQSLLPLFGAASEIDLLFRIGVSGILIIIGALIVRSAFITFGVDYMAVLYLYFPEESEIQEHEIYSVVRHPTYLGGVVMGLAALFFRFSVYSILMFVIIYLVFRLQMIREEKELVERFGDGYREYMEKVPAILVRPRMLATFFRFIRPK